MKKENTQIFTEDLSKYAAFLEATNKGLTQAVIEMKKEIESRNRIIKIVRKYDETHTLSTRELGALAKTSCPDFQALDSLIDLIQSFDIEPVASYIKESKYEKNIDCSNRTCQECWKNYINQTAHILNTSPIDIKNLTLDEDDE